VSYKVSFLIEILKYIDNARNADVCISVVTGCHLIQIWKKTDYMHFVKVRMRLQFLMAIVKSHVSDLLIHYFTYKLLDTVKKKKIKKKKIYIYI